MKPAGNHEASVTPKGRDAYSIGAGIALGGLSCSLRTLGVFSGGRGCAVGITPLVVVAEAGLWRVCGGLWRRLAQRGYLANAVFPSSPMALNLALFCGRSGKALAAVGGQDAW